MRKFFLSHSLSLTLVHSFASSMHLPFKDFGIFLWEFCSFAIAIPICIGLSCKVFAIVVVVVGVVAGSCCYMTYILVQNWAREQYAEACAAISDGKLFPHVYPIYFSVRLLLLKCCCWCCSFVLVSFRFSRVSSFSSAIHTYSSTHTPTGFGTSTNRQILHCIVGCFYRQTNNNSRNSNHFLVCMLSRSHFFMIIYLCFAATATDAAAVCGFYWFSRDILLK